MELRTLRTFVSVATHRSFSAAARELHTVQPAISRQIADLEAELGVSLLWRNTREVRVTAPGEALLEEAQRMLALEAQARKRVAMAASGQTGTLRHRLHELGLRKLRSRPDARLRRQPPRGQPHLA